MIKLVISSIYLNTSKMNWFFLKKIYKDCSLFIKLINKHNKMKLLTGNVFNIYSLDKKGVLLYNSKYLKKNIDFLKILNNSDFFYIHGIFLNRRLFDLELLNIVLTLKKKNNVFKKSIFLKKGNFFIVYFYRLVKDFMKYYYHRTLNNNPIIIKNIKKTNTHLLC